MNQNVWGIVLIGMILLNLGLGGWNIVSFMDNDNILNLIVGLFSITIGFYILHVFWNKWYPNYQLQQKMGKSDWREQA